MALPPVSASVNIMAASLSRAVTETAPMPRAAYSGAPLTVMVD